MFSKEILQRDSQKSFSQKNKYSLNLIYLILRHELSDITATSKLEVINESTFERYLCFPGHCDREGL